MRGYGQSCPVAMPPSCELAAHELDLELLLWGLERSVRHPGH